MRPVALPPKPPADDSKFRYQSAIETGVKATDLADCALDAQITVTARELLVMSTNVRRHVKDIITSRKVSANIVEVDEVDAYLASCSDPEPRAIYLDLLKYDSTS